MYRLEAGKKSNNQRYEENQGQAGQATNLQY